MHQRFILGDNFYLLDYIRKNIITDEIIFDALKFELDTRIYFYGQQYSNPREKWRINITSLFNVKKYFPIPPKMNQLLLRLRAIVDLRNKKVGTVPNMLGDKNNTHTNDPKIVSNAFFTANEELKTLGYNVVQPPWVTHSQNILTNTKLNRVIKIINNVILYGTFNDLISPRFIQQLHIAKEVLKKFYLENDVKALIVPIDIFLFENLSISIFKELNRPSFVFLHGLPGRYNSIDENRADYLVVWGDKIKETYIQAGIDKEKIFVSGHPLYQNFKISRLKFDFDNVLVLTKTQPWCQYGDQVILSDRGNLITYLFQIKKVLQSLGVKSVRLRPHPAENGEWYLNYVNRSFFKLDREPLVESLHKSTLVIGPSSTVFLETLYYGVNFVVFEPSFNNKDMINYQLFPPFDGSEKKVPVAKNDQELKEILLKKEGVDPNIFARYIKTPFDLSFMKKLIRD